MRRRLGTELRGLRKQALRSGQDVADSLGWSQAKISRTEQARSLPSIEDLQALIAELRPPAPMRKQLLLLAEEATRARPNQRNPSGADLVRRQRDLLALERASSAIRHYQPMQIRSTCRLADAGYEGAGHGVYTPVKKPSDGHALHINNRAYNKLLRSIRCLGERGFALLTQRWRVLQGVTTPPRKIGDIAKATLVLTHFEHGYLSC